MLCVCVIQGVNGELVWGEVESFAPWPAIIIPCDEQKVVQGKRLVEWYGQKVFSQVSHMWCQMTNSYTTD